MLFFQRITYLTFKILHNIPIRAIELKGVYNINHRKKKYSLVNMYLLNYFLPTIDSYLLIFIGLHFMAVGKAA